VALKSPSKKTIVTGALYGRGAARQDGVVRRIGCQQAMAGSKRSRSDTIAETLEGEYNFENEHDPQESDLDDEDDGDDLEVNEAVA